MAVGHEDRVPAECIITLRSYDFALTSSNEKFVLFSLSLTHSEDALGVSCVVIKILDHVPEAFTANRAQEILDVGSRKPVERIETQTDILAHYDGSLRHMLGCLDNLTLTDELRGALHFFQV